MSMVMTKRRAAAEPDLSALKCLTDLPSVSAADDSAREARAALNELEARDLVLAQRAQEADALTQRQAERERRQLRPQLEEATDLAEATRRAAEAVRAAARAKILDHNRPVFESKLRMLLERWAPAEEESAAVLAWLHDLTRLRLRPTRCIAMRSGT